MSLFGKPNPHQTINPVPKSEEKTRKGLLRFARESGGSEAVKELQLLFDKWDSIMKLAPESERQQMAEMAVLEVERLLSIHSDLRDGLAIDGKVVIPGNPGWRDE
jgi:hypothetical protein